VLVTGNGAGAVTSAPGGIDCGANCTATYESGTAVVLTAQPSAGSAFAGWSGGGCTGTGPCTVVMDADRAVTATFTAGVRLTVVNAGSGTGTVVSDPPGIDCGSRCTSGFDLGATVTLRATAAAGSRFTGWTGGGCSGTDACTVLMDSSKAVTATFEGQVALRVSVSGSGSGVVSSAPAGIKCSVGDVGACSASYPSGTLVELTATPQAGTVFSGWGGDCTGTVGNQCVVTMDAEKFVTAAFSGRKTLTVVKAGTGGGTVTSLPAGINCGGTCSAQYDFGTSVTLSAAPDTASTFVGWSGGGCGGTGTCTVVMNADTTVTATFAPARFNLTVTVDGPGSVSDSLGQIVDCRTTCTASYPNGSTVNLTATVVGDGAVFMGWSGACTGAGGCSVLMDQNRAVTATFGWPLTVRTAGSGSGTVTSSPPGINCGTDCDEVYRENTSVTLTATPAAGSTFTGWSGSGCTGTGTCTVTMNNALFVTATFEARRTLTVTVTIGTFGTGGTVRSASSQPGEPLIVCTAPPSGNVCTATYDNGVAVTLNATTGDLITWTGCTVTPQPNVCTLTMDANRAVTVEFSSIGAGSAKGGSGEAGPSGPGVAWVSLLEAPGAEGQLTFNGQQTAFAGPGVTRVAVATRPGENRVEGRLQSASGQPGTWRFELQSRDLVEPGSLRVLQGEPVLVLPDAIVFRVAGRPGEQVGFTFRAKP
jgi:Divergent InlB B-repeat domain